MVKSIKPGCARDRIDERCFIPRQFLLMLNVFIFKFITHICGAIKTALDTRVVLDFYCIMWFENNERVYNNNIVSVKRFFPGGVWRLTRFKDDKI